MWLGGRISFSYSFYNRRIRKLTGLSNLPRYQPLSFSPIDKPGYHSREKSVFPCLKFCPNKSNACPLAFAKFDLVPHSLPEARETLFRLRERRRDTKGGRLILSESTAHQG